MTDTNQTAADLNNACAKLHAMTDARLKAQQNAKRLNAEVVHKAKLVEEAIAAQERAIEASVEDSEAETVIPIVNRDALALAERKAQAANKALSAAHQAEKIAQEALARADKAHKIAAGLAAYQQLQSAIAKLPQLPIVLALQSDPDAGEELFAQGVRIQINHENHQLVLHTPRPAKVLDPIEAAASSLSAKAHPAALAHYQGKFATDHEVVTDARHQDLLHDEAHALRLAEQNLRTQSAQNPGMAVGFEAAHLAEVSAIKAKFIARRAALKVKQVFQSA